MSVFLLHIDTDPTEFAEHIFGGGLHGAKLRPDGNQGHLGLSPRPRAVHESSRTFLMKKRRIL